MKSTAKKHAPDEADILRQEAAKLESKCEKITQQLEKDEKHGMLSENDKKIKTEEIEKLQKKAEDLKLKAAQIDKNKPKKSPVKLIVLIGAVIVLLAAILIPTVIFLNKDNTKDKDGDAANNSENNPKVKVEMENGDTFVLELYPEYAPETVANFVKLVKEGFYDGTIFHRIVDGFMAQGGGQDINGSKKEADSINGEFSINGFTKNTLEHTKGVISMARADTTQYGDPVPGYNSASSEFFIMYDYPSHADELYGLDGKYAAFGKVIEGMEVVEKFQEAERVEGFDGAISQPVNPIVIKKMTVIE